MPASVTVRRTPTRLAIGVAINLLVAALHLVNLREHLRPALRPLVGSYFSDLTLPFAFYYLLCFVDDQVPRLRRPLAKAAVVFLAATVAELLQGIGIPALGRTFDPWDVGMYAAGVGLAAALDRFVLTPLVPAWPLVIAAAPDRGPPSAR